MALDSLEEIVRAAESRGTEFWQVVLETDCEERQVTAQASREKMGGMWRAMLESVEQYEAQRRSVSGLVGGDGAKMRDWAASGKALSGGYMQEVIATALCDALERHVPDAALTTHASITARPFFEKRGYAVVRAQQVSRKGILLSNFVMCKARPR